VAPGLLDQIRSWRFEPATAALGRLAEQSRALADRLGKGGLQVTVRAEHVRLDPNKWRLVLSGMVHLLRNAVDHGIESPEERLAAGKSAAGHVVLGAQLSSGMLSFEISNDSRGIDGDSIRRRGKARQLHCSTESELLAVLCTDGVSTKDESSDVSGRGVGMAAVKECIDQLGGRLEVHSSNQGTPWLIHFPRPRVGSQFPDATLSAPSLHATRSVAS
jgi:chemotaxis protein histidine kinase CheA